MAFAMAPDRMSFAVLGPGGVGGPNGPRGPGGPDKPDFNPMKHNPNDRFARLTPEQRVQRAREPARSVSPLHRRRPRPAERHQRNRRRGRGSALGAQRDPRVAARVGLA